MCTRESHDALKASREDFMTATREIEGAVPMFAGLIMRNCRQCGSTLAIDADGAGKLDSGAAQVQE